MAPDAQEDSSTPPPVTSPQARQLSLQLAAAFTVAALAWPYFAWRGESLPWPETAFAIAITAYLLASLTGQAWWWRLIHLLFAPLLWAASQLAIAPGWYLLAFLLLLLVFRGAAGGQVPLYLSNRATITALCAFLDARPELHFLDLGAGFGSVVATLAKQRPDGHFTGVENAPLTWLIGRIRCAGLHNCAWRWDNLWQIDLANFNVVHAFLSPTPMAALWEKACQQMAPGSLFISNSFPVPDVEPLQILEINDARQTRLFCYRI